MVLHIKEKYIVCWHVHEQWYLNGGNTHHVESNVIDCVARTLWQNLLCAHPDFWNTFKVKSSKKKIQGSIDNLWAAWIETTELFLRWNYVKYIIKTLDRFVSHSYKDFPTKPLRDWHNHPERILSILKELEDMLFRCWRIDDWTINLPWENNPCVAMRALNPWERNRFHFLVFSCQRECIPLIENIIDEIRLLEREVLK